MEPNFLNDVMHSRLQPPVHFTQKSAAIW